MDTPALPLRNLRVSDHALLRYIERKKLLRQDTLDLVQLRTEIMPTCPRILAAIDQLGDGTYDVSDSHRVRIVDRVVVTVLPMADDPRPPAAKNKHFTNRNKPPGRKR